ncbi:MAG: hypothetical protein ACYTHJ_08420 [Planctomycetota bacterium]|jgi:hypothetical protein
MKRIPKLCHHRPSDRAYARFSGRTIYFGAWGSDEANRAYEAHLAKWLEVNRNPIMHVSVAGPTVAQVVAEFLDHAKDYYHDHRTGGQLREYGHFKYVTRPLLRLYAATPANEFGPLEFEAVRATFIERGNCRRTINDQANRIRCERRMKSVARGG